MRHMMRRMRTAYRERLDAFAHDLILMGDTVQSIMTKASRALLQGSLQSAEESLSLSDDLEELRVRCEERAVELLVLEGPVARDLRQVVSSIYIVEDFNRMGTLALHVARASRRRHPQLAVPEQVHGYFREMARLVNEMCNTTRGILIEPDADVAINLNAEDDAVDDLNEHLLMILTQRKWTHSVREAVDVALLSRFYERYADHCVNVAARIVYLTTGLMPADYLAKRESDEADADTARRFAELDRQLSHHGRGPVIPDTRG